MNTTENEKWYDEYLAPELLRLGKECENRGLSFLAVVEWEPGKTGETRVMNKVHGFGFEMTLAAATAHGNVDAFWRWVQRHAKEKGHGSIFLHHQGIPETPVKGEPT